jgi:hypothetical protein
MRDTSTSKAGKAPYELYKIFEPKNLTKQKQIKKIFSAIKLANYHMTLPSLPWSEQIKPTNKKEIKFFLYICFIYIL